MQATDIHQYTPEGVVHTNTDTHTQAMILPKLTNSVLQPVTLIPAHRVWVASLLKHPELDKSFNKFSWKRRGRERPKHSKDELKTASFWPAQRFPKSTSQVIAPSNPTCGWNPALCGQQLLHPGSELAGRDLPPSGVTGPRLKFTRVTCLSKAHRWKLIIHWRDQQEDIQRSSRNKQLSEVAIPILLAHFSSNYHNVNIKWLIFPPLKT